jgi:hypothetical protein
MEGWTQRPHFPVLRLDSATIKLNPDNRSLFVAELALSQSPAAAGLTCGVSSGRVSGTTPAWWLPIFISVMNNVVSMMATS